MKQFNLLPANIVRDRTRKALLKKIKVIGAGLSVVVTVYGLTIAGLIHLQNHRIDELRQVVAEAEQVQQQRDTQQAAYRQAQATLAIRHRLDPVMSPKELLTILSQVVPEHTGLTALKWETTPAVLLTDPTKQAAPKPIGATCQIQGIARDEQEIAKLLSALNKHELFSEAHLERSEPVDVKGSKMRRFTIVATLRANCRFERAQLAGVDHAH